MADVILHRAYQAERAHQDSQEVMAKTAIMEFLAELASLEIKDLL